MPSEAPLRISKSTPSSSPSKMASSSPYRPLAEIGPTERRRNSPSYNQATKQMLFKRENSPFDSSPWSAERTSSTRTFWQDRDPTSPSRLAPSENAYDQESSVSPQRRSSIENLKRVSRVKNSSMFEREQRHQYDPASPQLDRPLAVGRPLSLALQGNAFNGEGLEGFRKANIAGRGHKRGQSLNSIPAFDTLEPSKLNQSNMSDASQMDHDRSIVSDAGSEVKVTVPRPLRRQAKSVTFDSGPPEVNEYEMVTPDPSSVASGSREGSYDVDDDNEYDYDLYDRDAAENDDSFDASLEDTDKTPVVLPEDWRHMSPDNANSDLAEGFDDPFEASKHARPVPVRSESVTSDGDRPLPPLPGTRDSLAPGLAATAERIGSSPRSLPSPPRAAGVSKAEIIGMQKRSSMSFEDRFRLMGLQDAETKTSPVRKNSDGRASRAAKLQAAHNKDQGLGIQIHEDATASKENGASSQDLGVPHISRESVLKKLKAQETENPYDGSGYGDDVDYANLDPDVPIPSREASSSFDDIPHADSIKQEDDISEVDVYDIPDMYSAERSLSRMENHDREGSVVRPMSTGSDQGQKLSSSEDDGPPTPKADSFLFVESNTAKLRKPQDSFDSSRTSSNSLPEFESMIDDDDFKSGLESFLSRDDFSLERKLSLEMPSTESKSESDPLVLQRPSTPTSETHQTIAQQEELAEMGAPDSPGSIIHHSPVEEATSLAPEYIPERLSSIKAPGSKLKARPSLTLAEVEDLTASRQDLNVPSIPSIPRKSSRRRSSIGVSHDTSDVDEVDDSEVRKSSLQKIQLDSFTNKDDFGLSMELGEEFDRVIEAQKKGYMMRQNNKVVVARARDFSDEKVPISPDANARGGRSAGPSPRKTSGQSKPWTTEQWNGNRRKSIRTASGSRKHNVTAEPAPPLPGQESTVSGAFEDTTTRESYEECEWEEGAERGRLFVKVVGVKDLELPLPKHERTQFQLTLDNGLHCVTTSWLDLSKSAPIGQEFELVVLNDLEFQLTLQTKLTPPPMPLKTTSVASSPTKAAQPNMKKKSLSHLLMSPKKRKEVEARRLAEEQEQRDREAAAARHRAVPAKPQPKSAWDLLHDLVAPDGSFARAYISLKSFEDNCYGKPLSVDVPCYNEWAAEHDPSVIESMRSKRGTRVGEVVRMPPYQVGKLQLMLLYVPKPKGAKEEDMPRSLNSAVREMDKVREAGEKKFEGILSQQGGDCPYWRRRFFRLAGTKLTAFHESTRQPRATINLIKAVKLIDDKSSLVQDPTGNTSRKSRRKSAFAEEEDGYMFVEEGFRIRFANGETIDFYADSAAQKIEWMRVLSEIIGKPGQASSDGRKGWTELVLRREQRKGFDRKPLPSGSVKRKEVQSEAEAERPSSEQGQKRSMLEARDELKELKPVPLPKDQSPNKAARMRVGMTPAERRAKTRSMIF